MFKKTKSPAQMVRLKFSYFKYKFDVNRKKEECVPTIAAILDANTGEMILHGTLHDANVFLTYYNFKYVFGTNGVWVQGG